MTPKRVQRQRTKGWRMPEGAVYVGRPSRWGNPFPIVQLPRAWAVEVGGMCYGRYPTERDAARASVGWYEHELVSGSLPFTAEDVQAALEGCDLACWCPLDQACHAAVLLRIANGEPA